MIRRLPRNDSVAINVSDYLIFRVAADVLGNNIRLISFNADCASGGAFVSRVLCDAAIRLQVNDREAEAKITSVDIGAFVALEERLLTNSASAAVPARSQVKTLIDQLVARLAANICTDN